MRWAERRGETHESVWLPNREVTGGDRVHRHVQVTGLKESRKRRKEKKNHETGIPVAQRDLISILQRASPEQTWHRIPEASL